MGRSTAKDRVRVATSLRLLPQIEEALRKGDLSYSKVRALTRVATEDNETWLLAQAFDHSAAQLERWVRRIRNGDLERSGADALRAYERRHLSLYVRDDGVGCITVELAEEDLELIKQALEFVSSSLPKLDGQSIQARQANALVQMARDILRGGGDAGHAGDNYQVVVHVDESALKGHGGESDLPLETVRRLACDGSVVALLKNHAGEPLSIGRKQRAIPTAMRRALEGRDRTCRFPGCGHDKWLHGHHIKHWALGGETSLRNLLLLCGHHHRLVHEGGFQIKRASSGEHYFAKPDGKPMDGIIFRGR
jgi:transposase-like protein